MAKAEEEKKEEKPKKRAKKAPAKSKKADAVEASDASATTPENDKPKTDKEKEAESIHEKYERVKKGDLHIKDLQGLEASELHKVAKKEGLKEYMGLNKQELIFRILKERIRQNGLMFGEGVLEVLPDGFGFL